MKKFLLIPLIVFLLASPFLVQAQGGINPVSPPGEINFERLITYIINWAFGLLIVLAAAFILWAGFIYLTAAGDPEKVGRARTLIIYAVIAIVIGFAARGIVTLVRQILQV